MLHVCLVSGVHKTFFFRIMILYFTTFILLFHHGKYNTITFSHGTQPPPPCYVVSDHLSPVSGARLPLLATGAGLTGKPHLAFDWVKWKTFFTRGVTKLSHSDPASLQICIEHLTCPYVMKGIIYHLWLSSGDLMSSPWFSTCWQGFLCTWKYEAGFLLSISICHLCWKMYALVVYWYISLTLSQSSINIYRRYSVQTCPRFVCLSQTFVKCCESNLTMKSAAGCSVLD